MSEWKEKILDIRSAVRKVIDDLNQSNLQEIISAACSAHDLVGSTGEDGIAFFSGRRQHQYFSRQNHLVYNDLQRTRKIRAHLPKVILHWSSA